MEQKEQANIRDNSTKLIIAQINSSDNLDDGIEELSPEKKEELHAKIEDMNRRFKLDKEKFLFEKKKHSEDNALKDKISLRQSKRKLNESELLCLST